VVERKSYGQFCGLARALDRVGDRWTLLILRELTLGSRSFHELEHHLPGISPSLLASRVATLVGDGLVIRNDAPRRSKAVQYSLSPAGEALEPALLELIKWGTRWMMDGPGDDFSDPRWAPLALRALLEGGAAQHGRLHIDVEGVAVTVRARRGRKEVLTGHTGSADSRVSGPLPVILGVASGALPFNRADARVDGDRAVAAALLSPR
jgi:DNA-binding HxlR family transcriptional regulator